MGKHGPEFYDDEAVFAAYMSARAARVDTPNDTLEKPVFDEMVGELTHLRILDLGCGNAAFGLEALAKGCQSYLGIDGSKNMIDAAREKLAGTDGQALLASIEEWDYPMQQFDLVTSRLALHYTPEIEPLFIRIFQSLVAGGRFLFSIEHPVITSCDRARQNNELRQDWIVDGYFDTGPRQTSWMGDEVIKYHRTLEDYFFALRAAGFAVDGLRESPATGPFSESGDVRTP